MGSNLHISHNQDMTRTAESKDKRPDRCRPLCSYCRFPGRMKTDNHGGFPLSGSIDRKPEQAKVSLQLARQYHTCRSARERRAAMNISAIRERGLAMEMTGLEQLSKGEMIRAIQLREGSRDCFGNFWRFDCLEFDCCWREDCLTMQPG